MHHGVLLRLFPEALAPGTSKLLLAVWRHLFRKGCRAFRPLV